MSRYITCMDCELMYRDLEETTRAIVRLRMEDPPVHFVDIGELMDMDQRTIRRAYNKALRTIGLAVLRKVYGVSDKT